MINLANTKRISKYILQELKEGNISKDTAISLVKQLNEKEDIAIIGMACRFNDTDDYNDLWDFMANKKSSVERCQGKRIQLIKPNLPYVATDKIEKYCKGGYFKNIDEFDHKFFSFSKNDADLLYPGIRIALEAGYRALEDAGYLGERLKDNRTGVYIGNNFTKDTIFSYMNVCLQNTNYTAPFEAMLNNWSSGIATRISNYFNLKGPCYTVDASCPSSMVAIVNACNAIKQNLCTTALAGGMHFDMSPVKLFSNQGWVFSHPDNVVTKLFDNNSKGSYQGEGFGIVLLKSLSKALEDGDHIHAVICGTGHNNNGSNGEYAQSSVEDIKKVVIETVREAEIDVTDIGFMMGEGYLNKMEEGLEVSGLIEGLNHFTNRRQFCAFGGNTANLGYLQSAVGIFNTLIGALALENKTIPPLLHFTSPTDMINVCKSPFYFNDICKEWDCAEEKTRYAANYTYGFGGTNMLLIMREAPKQQVFDKIEREELFVLSAKTKYSMERNIKAYIEFLSSDSQYNLSEICYNACIRRKLFTEYRLAIYAKDSEDLLKKLKLFDETSVCNSEVFYEEHISDQKKKIRYESPENKDKLTIGKEFCSGSNFEYSKLFEGLNIGFCKLPRYVFDKQSCWCHKQKRKKRFAFR